MLCPSCGAENPSSFSFCNRCGAPLPRLCPRCGFENPGNFSFCSHCGADLTMVSPSSALTHPESERRFAVVLFADIAGFTRMSEHLDPEEATELVNRFLDEMTTAVLQYGGRVDKYMGDGLMAVFGIPTARNDDLEQALRAAMAMRESTAGLWSGPEIPPIALHIGLACGPVVIAGVGSKGHRERTLIGTSVSLAARLEEASVPGQILVSEEIARLTEHAFQFQPVTLSGLTGWEGTVQAFELLSERRAGQPPGAGELYSPLVGREAEIAILWQSLQNLTAGKGAIISIIGNTGIGKSRLVAEIRARAQREGLLLRWLEAYPAENERTSPWSSFRTLLQNAIGVTPHTAPSETHRRLLGFLRDSMREQQADEFHPYLGWLLGLPLEPAQAERVERIGEEELGWRLLQVFQHGLAALAARKPVVLVFEDLDRADLPSVKLLERMLPLTTQTPLAIWSLYCPEPERPSWRLREIAGKRYGNIYSELWLHPLPPAAAREMVIHLLGVDRSLEKAVDLILQRAEGNPLFIKEIICSMADQGILVQRADGKWEMTPDREPSQEILPPLGDGPASPDRSDAETDRPGVGRGNRRPSR